MFSFTDPVADDAAVSSAPSASLADAARDMQRQGRQREARMVLLAYRLGLSVSDDFVVNPVRQNGIRDAADKAAVGEVSLQLGVSRSQAGKWLTLGAQLQRMPQLRLAFLEGDFALHRISVISAILGVVDDDLRGVLEPLALGLARRATTDPMLRSQLEKLLIELDPDAAAAARKDFAERNQNVIVRPDAFGHNTVDATVPAEHGVFLRERLAALLALRVCKHDPRTTGQQRVAALAELMGFPAARLTCACGRDGCGRGVDEPAPASGLEPEAASGIVVVVDPDDGRAPHLRGHGAIDPGHAAEIGDAARQIELPAESIVAGAGGGDGPAPPIDPTGHGGFSVPPPGALVYQPSKQLRAQILATDLWCRYPYCGNPSHACEIDHLVKFDHADPNAGGWTVAYNLIPMCTPDHHRKHLGVWIPTMHTDRSITWRNSVTGQQIVTYPR
ncbi:HNH endonuclease [Gordonia sp. SID5947]|uniref:HNH endonuclease signature motif containing protein n=1 Tax=Gordonia sp. SID5947 TaxID=2690315 RepID=UPI001369FC07|nr:HNH endonuclease signature motif containing protein [Gordonia sp. SID5947]MYR07452.1 HNH endonuclease [Gordonia sp. SID5947]